MKADDAMQPSAFIFFYFVGNSKTPNDVFGFFYWLKATAVWVDGCTAVNWLVPLRCRWQIQQGREQEKTRSNAKRYKRAVRLCFWPRGSLDYIKNSKISPLKIKNLWLKHKYSFVCRFPLKLFIYLCGIKPYVRPKNSSTLLLLSYGLKWTKADGPVASPDFTYGGDSRFFDQQGRKISFIRWG